MSSTDVEYQCLSEIQEPNDLGIPSVVVASARFFCPINLAEGSDMHFSGIVRKARFSNGATLRLPDLASDAGMAPACEYCRHQLRCLDTQPNIDPLEVLSPGFILEPPVEVA